MSLPATPAAAFDADSADPLPSASGGPQPASTPTPPESVSVHVSHHGSPSSAAHWLNIRPLDKPYMSRNSRIWWPRSVPPEQPDSSRLLPIASGFAVVYGRGLDGRRPAPPWRTAANGETWNEARAQSEVVQFRCAKVVLGFFCWLGGVAGGEE